MARGSTCNQKRKRVVLIDMGQAEDTLYARFLKMEGWCKASLMSIVHVQYVHVVRLLFSLPCIIYKIYQCGAIDK